MKRLPYIIIAILILIPLFCWAKHEHPERWYQEKWCNKCGGIIEYRLQNGTRVDCLTDEYAIEFDFAVKLFEATGQALYYAAMTGKQPGIVLIMEKESDAKYLKRLMVIIERFQLPIKVWTMGP